MTLTAEAKSEELIPPILEGERVVVTLNCVT